MSAREIIALIVGLGIPALYIACVIWWRRENPYEGFWGWVTSLYVSMLITMVPSMAILGVVVAILPIPTVRP